MIVVVALALVALASAAPALEEPSIPIVRSNYDQQPDGGYEFGFESANGILRTETGVIKEALDDENKPHAVVVVRGSFTYQDPEGKVETVNYFADETGYHAEGDSIPVPVARR